MKLRLRHALFAFAMMATFAGAPAHASDDCLEIAFSDKAAFKDAQIAVFEKIYDEAGLCLKPAILPNKRGNTMLAAGLIDGDAIGGLRNIEADPNLIRVTTPILRDKDVIISKTLEPIQSLDQLSGLHVGVSRGVLWDQYLSQIPGLVLDRVKGRRQLISLLYLDRVDAVAIRQSYYKVFSEEQQNSTRATHVIYNLGDVFLYHSLHIKHQDKAERINSAVADLQARGKIPSTGKEWATLYHALKNNQSWPQFSAAGKSAS